MDRLKWDPLGQAGPRPGKLLTTVSVCVCVCVCVCVSSSLLTMSLNLDPFYADVSRFIHYVSNVTVPIGRDAIFTCVVDSIDSFKVRKLCATLPDRYYFSFLFSAVIPSSITVDLWSIVITILNGLLLIIGFSSIFYFEQYSLMIITVQFQHKINSDSDYFPIQIN